MNDELHRPSIGSILCCASEKAAGAAAMALCDLFDPMMVLMEDAVGAEPELIYFIDSLVATQPQHLGAQWPIDRWPPAGWLWWEGAYALHSAAAGRLSAPAGHAGRTTRARAKASGA